MSYPKAIVAAKRILEDRKIIKPPVDIREVINFMGIVISEAPNKDQNMSGLILRGSSKTLIGVNSSHTEHRKRFTLAHELGHYELHSKQVFIDTEDLYVGYRKKSNAYDPKESEANAFAAELLMPEDWVRDEFATLCKSLNNVDKIEKYQNDIIAHILSEKFNVSLEAMQIRINFLSLK